MLDEDTFAMAMIPIFGRFGYVSKGALQKRQQKPIFMENRIEVNISRMLTRHAVHREYTRDQTHRLWVVEHPFYW